MKSNGLIIGHIRDSTIAHVRTVAWRLGADVPFVDVGEYVTTGSITDATSSNAVLTVSGHDYPLGGVSCIYQRASIEPDPPPWSQSRLLALETALLSSGSEVINRPLTGWQNMSKPLQMLMLESCGFVVPSSRATSVPEDYQDFRTYMGDIIYKSNSGQRSIVDRVSTGHDQRAELLSHCPALFQQRIVGNDIRVHVVHEEIFAVKIQSDAVDYRYYKSRGSFAKLQAEPLLPSAIGKKCIEFAAASGVALAGFDFKVDDEGCWYCLEMNPAPAFESYDHVMNGAIARRIVAKLAGYEHVAG